MKKLTLLLLLFPLIGFSQEMPVATFSSSTWTVNQMVITNAQNFFDSVAADVYTVDSADVISGGKITLFFHDDTAQYSDEMFVLIQYDTAYTTPEPAFYACGSSCQVLEYCVGGCYKKVDCDCDCTGTGACFTVWLSLTNHMGIGQAVRERILISNGHYIPRD